MTLKTTCAALYDREAKETTRDLSWLKGCYFDHLPELGSGELSRKLNNERVEIRVLKHVDFDQRRYWRLATVWLDDRPVMVIQNAGREGDDHSARFITDRDAFYEMLAYVAGLSTTSAEIGTTVDANEERDDLLSFYGDDVYSARPFVQNPVGDW